MNVFRSMLIMFLSFSSIGNVKGENNTKSILEFKLYQYPTIQGITFPRVIGVTDTHSYLKRYISSPIYNYDKFYIQGVGLFEQKINQSERDVYVENRKKLIEISKIDFPGVNRSRQFSVTSQVDGNLVSEKISIESAMRSNANAKSLNNWFNVEEKNMVFNPNMIMKTGVLIDGNMEVGQESIEVKITIDNPSNESITIYGFDKLIKENRTRKGQSIQLRISYDYYTGVSLFLNSKYFQGDLNESINLKKKSKTIFVFKYKPDEFYAELLQQNNKELVDKLANFEHPLKFDFKINNKFRSPSVISNGFEYITLNKELDFSTLKLKSKI